MLQQWIATGFVQGVGFRYFVYGLAQKWHVQKGFVRNLKDGSVEIVFEDFPSKESFLQDIQNGTTKSPDMKVQTLVCHNTDFQCSEALVNFQIR